MSRSKTAEEVRAEYIEILGEECGQYLYDLRNELSWVSLKWNEFLEIYGKDQEQLDLLNRVAPGFFRRIQDQLFHDILLHLCRLTDRAEMGGRDNLSVRRLPSLIDEPDLAVQVTEAVNNAVECTAFARSWRNRRVAHRDLETMRDAKSAALPPARKREVDAALEALSRCLNAINGWYRNSEEAFRMISDPWGAGEFLSYLRKGVEAVEEKERRLREG